MCANLDEKKITTMKGGYDQLEMKIVFLTISNCNLGLALPAAKCNP